MFEAESEIWAKENMDCVKTVSFLNHDCNYYSDEERCVAKSAFQAGATLVYNKANEWHYPSKGEYPDECENVWCYCKGPGIKFCCAGHIIINGDNKVRWWANNKSEELRVIAWKEIVLPEEK